MKREIYGRKVGTPGECKLLISSDGASGGGKKTDPEKLREFELVNTRRAVATFREKGVEGYVLFEGDAHQYKFTPSDDFTHPSQLMCDYQGKHFGASYEDACCIDGFLWDLDSCDEPGGGLSHGGDIPCPQCNAEAHAAYFADEAEDAGA